MVKDRFKWPPQPGFKSYNFVVLWKGRKYLSYYVTDRNPVMSSDRSQIAAEATDMLWYFAVRNSF